MELRTAAPEDLGKIMELIDQAKAFLKRNGVDQWQNGYPDQTCIEEDIRKNNFNPLKRMYNEPDFEEECRTILTMMMSECCKEFERLPILENVEILRNILYSGVWCRYEAVREKRRAAVEKKNE